MQFQNTFKKIKKPLLISLSVIFGLLILIIVLLAPIAKYSVEKYDTKFLGRQITMDLPYINPLTGFVYLRNLKIYEGYNDSVFIYARSLSVNVEMLKIFSKSFETSEITLNEPVIRLMQNKKMFNFSDIINRFSKKDKTKIKTDKSNPVTWQLSDVNIKNGIVQYEERSIPFKYFIKEFNVNSEIIGGKNDTLAVNFDFKSGTSFGSAAGLYSMNLDNLNYAINVSVKKFDISFLESYVKDIANFAFVRGNVDSDVIAFGNIKQTQDLTSSGNITINDCCLGKSQNEDYASIKKFNISYTQISPKKKIYNIDSVHLLKPYFKYEMYDEGDNIQMMFGKKGERVKNRNAGENNNNILFVIGEFAKRISLNFFKGAFKVNKIGIYDGKAVYNDYRLTEKFGIALHPLNLSIDSIERKDNWVDAVLRSKIDPYGDVSIKMSINPKDSSDFNINYTIKDVPAALFNPYLLSYSSYPLDRGTIEIKGNWVVNNGVINSQNNLLVIDPRISDKQKSNGTKWQPLKLAMFFIRERGNVIDYDLPIKGNLKDPTFKIKDIVIDILSNIVIKPVTPVYRYQIKVLENEIGNSLSLKWKLKEAKLKEDQTDFMDDMVEYLKESKKTSITIKSLNYVEKEKEYIALFEGKKRFMTKMLGFGSILSADDSLMVDQLSIKDKMFNDYLKKSINKPLVFTTQEYCRLLVGEKFIDEKFETLKNNRFKLIKAYFVKNGVANQVKFDKTDYSKVPYDGYSLFRISYEGKLPDYLIEAFEDIRYFDSHNPREKYKVKRKEIRKKRHKR